MKKLFLSANGRQWTPMDANGRRWTPMNTDQYNLLRQAKKKPPLSSRQVHLVHKVHIVHITHKIPKPPQPLLHTPMKISYDCYPCFMRLLVESSELAGASEPAREAALRELLEHLLATPRDTPPPLMGMAIQRIVKRAAQNPDPYKELKERFNRAALELYPVLKQRIRQSPRPLETAARLAIAGNIIDNGYSPNLTREAVESALAECLAAEPSVNDFPLLEKEIARAKSILYLADNAGEIVFDRLFIEEFPKGKTTVVVRGAPILNDVLLEDARAVGLDSVAEIISNGHDAPGTWLPDCPKEFRERFAAADLVIAKGQGNYETLSETPRPNLFFLLKAKCPVVAREFGAAPGALIIRQCSASR